MGYTREGLNWFQLLWLSNWEVSTPPEHTSKQNQFIGRGNGSMRAPLFLSLSLSLSRIRTPLTICPRHHSS